ncbi:MAG: hypothetical protein LQ348_005983 [Seirophora lacunosa]|nr:MAG: hypothetical protein LQ348_005983 [Seirophora lacunosa]
MTREATLLAKHEDLKKCSETRSSLLLELYRSTAVLSNIIKKQSCDNSSLLNIDPAAERAFLEANDLSTGRYFHPSTLPPLSPKLSQHHNSPLTQSETWNTSYAIDRPVPLAVAPAGQPANAPAVGDVDLTSTSLNKVTSTVPVISADVNLQLAENNRSHGGENGAGGVVAKIQDSARRLGSDMQAASNDSQKIKPLDVAPLLDDDAKQIPDSVSQKVDAESRPDGARSLRLPPREKHEERFKCLDSGTANHGHQSPSGRVSNEGRPPILNTDERRTQSLSHHDIVSESEPPSNQPPFTQPAVHDDVGVKSDSVLESQMEMAHADAAVGRSPFTPDEQLRLEEAQSLQGQITDTMTGLSKEGTPDANAPKYADSAPTQADEDSTPTIQTRNLEIKVLDDLRRGQQHADAASENSYLRDHAYSGLAGGVAKDITLSQRPPMRIDTELSQQSDLSRTSNPKKPPENNAASTHTPPDSATSARASQSSAPAQSPPERMTTRVSSGALRHKSVSEILGEIPKSVTPHTEKALNERTTSDINRDAAGLQSPRSSASVSSPDPATFRLRLSELKERDKSKLSTVVFARKQPLQSTRHSENLLPRDAEAVQAKSKSPEYLYPLLHAQAASPPRAQLLNRLIGSASKTLTTANHYVDNHEQQYCRILSRIEQLQKANGWSLRQLERSGEPERPTVHWDVLLSQMKWLRTDFREERKWKVAAASSVASWCAQWVASTKEERIALQVETRPQSRSIVRAAAPESALTPDLIPSAADDSSDAADEEIDHPDATEGKAPAAIFSMAPDMFYFGLQRTPSAEKLLQELPLYQPSFEIQQAALHHSSVNPDKEWMTALLPVSRFCDGKLVSHDEGPPRKKSRYDYAELDEDDRFASTEIAGSGDGTPDARPEQDDVALFKPENKHIRDRIHAGHAFRPPSEYVMPSQSFFESRQSSQWTQVEDDELRRLVREYAYNWSLISSCLAALSAFSSGAERRTPWECFERWIGLEGLPAEMAKTQYFRAYHGRLQAAQTTHEAQQQLLQQQQQQGSNAPQMPLRRRSTQPVQVERRRSTKYLHLVNAMKNLARKRENVPKKTEKAMDSAAIRKPGATAPGRHTMQTPQEFSRLRHERDTKLQEQAKVYRMQMMQQQKRSVVQPGQQPQAANLPQPARSALPAIPNGNGPTNPLPNGQMQQSMHGQPRLPQMPRPTNGVPSSTQFPTNHAGIPHAPMQPAQMPGSARLPPQMGSESMRVFQEASRVQAEQQRFLQQQRQQHPHVNGQLSPNPANANLVPPHASTTHASFQRRSGSPSVNGAPAPNNSSSTSPRMANPAQPQALSSGMTPTINQIHSQIRARNPNLPQEQISQMATDKLKQYHAHSHAHAAMQAAAGSNVNAVAMNSNAMGSLQPPSQQQPPTAIMNSSPLSNTPQYAQMIRSQQQQQQQHAHSRSSGTPFSSGQRPPSRGTTPQLHRTPSAQGLHPSPSPVPSQVAGGQ